MSMIGNYRRIKESELSKLLENPETITELLYSEEADRYIDVDKAWHAIHFLLNGAAWEGERPLVNVVLGGVPVGEEDVGYGPARYLLPDQVRDVSRALENISTEELWSCFDANAMKQEEIYPGFDGDDDDRNYICGYFENVKSFYALAASQGDAMLLYLN